MILEIKRCKFIGLRRFYCTFLNEHDKNILYSELIKIL